MKKFLKLILAGFFLLFLIGNSYALVIPMEDWHFDPSGALNPANVPGSFGPIDQITFLGTAFITNDSVPGPGVGFSELGTFQATSFQNDSATILPGISGLGVDYELTAVLTATGVNTTLVGTEQSFSFLTATLDI